MAVVLAADPAGGLGVGLLPEDQQLAPRIRAVMSHASDLTRDIGDGMKQHIDAGGKPITSLGISLSNALHTTLQQSMTDEQYDPAMQALAHDHPDQYADHVHGMHQADLAVETLSGLLGAFEQAGR